MAAGTLAHTRVNLIVLTQYRANFAIWALSSTLQAVVALAVWQAVAAAEGGSTGVYDPSAFAGYFLLLRGQFYWALGFPVELLVGKAPASDSVVAVAVLATWSIILLAILQPLWRVGTRAFESVGT